MKHRIFIALPISESLQQEILEWEEKFSNLPIRWLQGKNLHITLVPPWHEENLEGAKNLLEQATGSGYLNLEFEKVTFGPDPRRPRLIWAEGETPRQLIDLRRKVHQIFGREEEKRPFRLHLAIARFRPETFSSFPIKKLDEKVNWRDEVRRVGLFESRLLREGADYQIMAEIAL